MPGARGIVGYSDIERCSSIGMPDLNNVQEKFRRFDFRGMTGLAVDTAAGCSRHSVMFGT
jgi:hypothetical protein